MSRLRLNSLTGNSGIQEYGKKQYKKLSFPNLLLSGASDSGTHDVTKMTRNRVTRSYTEVGDSHDGYHAAGIKAHQG
jgi:hypothetical protein